MAQFKAFSPISEVLGQGILILVEGMGPFRPTALKILEEQGICDVQADEWYPMQAYLDAYRQIAERVGPMTLKMIGKKVPEVALWPPHIKSVEAALSSIDVAYHMNNRGGDVGFYKFEKTGTRNGKMICRNPYPCLFDVSLVETVTKKFATNKIYVKVTHDHTQECRQTGGETCTLLVSW